MVEVDNVREDIVGTLNVVLAVPEKLYMLVVVDVVQEVAPGADHDPTGQATQLNPDVK